MARSVVRDFKSSVNYNGSSAYTAVTPVAGLPVVTGAHTIVGWVKLSNTGGGTIYSEGATGGPNPLIIIGPSGGKIRVFRRSDSGGATHGNLTSNTSVGANTWFHYAYVDDNAGNVMMYFNGALDSATLTYTPAGTFTANQVTLGAARYGGSTTDFLNGNECDMQIFNRVLSATEIATLYRGTTTSPSNLQARYQFNEVSGATAADTSGNANTGTLTNAKFSGDIPLPLRQTVGGNMVRNPSFDAVPPFIGATTGTTVWIDGTIGGNGASAASIWGWYLFSRTGTSSAQYDTTEKNSGNASLKVSTSAIASQIVVATSSNTVASLSQNPIPVTPGVNYTLSFYMKTVANSGSATTGAQMLVRETAADASQVAQNVTNTGVTTTTGWTKYTYTFTTAANTRYVILKASVVGSDGTATLIMDAWFDDIIITETVPVGRSAVQDFKASLGLAGAGVVSVPSSVNNNFTTAFTVAAWVKQNATPSGTNEQFVLSKPLADGTNYRFALGVGIGSNNYPYFAIYDGVNLPQAIQSIRFPQSQWVHMAGVYNGSTLKLYINGVQVASANNTATLAVSTGAFEIGRRAGLSDRWWKGNLAAVKTFGTALTAAQIAQEMATGSTTVTPVQVHMLGEGAGTTALDTSGNANNGTTLGTLTYSLDVPSRKRQYAGGNLVYNGDFEYAPPTNVAQSTTSNWIDGTIGGSGTFNPIAWYLRRIAGTSSALFDNTVSHSGTYSMKLSCQAVGGRLFVYHNAAIGGGGAIANKASGVAIPSLANTSYTCSYWMRTNLVSGAAQTGARLEIQKKGTDGASAETFVFNTFGVVTTTGWTQYSFTFTTAAIYGEYYLVPTCVITGNDGAATLIMDAWFDDIVITQNNTTRVIA
jgi:hypothetical protein